MPRGKPVNENARSGVTQVAFGQSSGPPSGSHLHFGDPPEAQRLLYVPWLLWEVFKANVDVARRVLTPGRLPISPRFSPLGLAAPKRSRPFPLMQRSDCPTNSAAGSRETQPAGKFDAINGRLLLFLKSRCSQCGLYSTKYWMAGL